MHFESARERGPAVALAIAIALGIFEAQAAAAQPAPAAPREEIGVFAAASLADVLTEIGNAWEASCGHHPVFNFGGSSDLARQILAGAPADVFFSADSAQMGLLVRQGLARAADTSELLSNALVVIVPASSGARVTAARDLEAFAKIAVADPQAVPAGVYARSWLEAEGVWSSLAGRIVPMLHVRAALAAVESGNVDAGIVYKTDAARSSRARIALEVTPERGPQIRYPAAPLVGAKPAAASFVAYVRSPAAREVFVRHGFLVLGGQ